MHNSLDDPETETETDTDTDTDTDRPDRLRSVCLLLYLLHVCTSRCTCMYGAFLALVCLAFCLPQRSRTVAMTLPQSLQLPEASLVL